MKPLEIQRYNLIYRERFIKKFYYNLNEQKLIPRGQLLKIYYVNIGLNHMLFAMRNLRGLLNCLLHNGPHGKHFVMVFEILGVNLLEVIKRYNYKGVPMPLVRILAR